MTIRRNIYILVFVVLIVLGYFVSKEFLFLPEMPTCKNVPFTELSYKEIDEKEYYVNEDDEIVISLNDYERTYLKEGYINIELDGKQGVIDTLCNVLINPKYETVVHHYLNDQHVFYIMDDDQAWFLDENLEINQEAEYDYISHSFIVGVHTLIANGWGEEDLYDTIYYNYLVEVDGLWGLSDFYGNLIIPIEYQDISIFSSSKNLLEVRQNGLSGIINENNQIVLPIEYTSVRRYSLWNSDNEAGYLNSDGSILIEPKYGNITNVPQFDSPKLLFIAYYNNGWGFINEDEEVLIDFTHQGIDEIKGYLRIVDDDLYGIYTYENVEVIPQVYSSLKLYDGYIFAEKDGVWGIIDYGHNTLIDFEYDSIAHYHYTDVEELSFIFIKGDEETIIPIDSIYD